MYLKVNGEPREVSEGATLMGLLSALGVEAETVAVQRNGDILDRANFGVTELAHGDAIEVIHCVAGG
jgi:sulfur carrier protein